MLVAIFAPLLAPHDPDAIESSRVLRGLSLAHPFGSDALGRDVLSRVIFSFRVSLSVAVGSVLLAFIVGVPLGLHRRLLRGVGGHGHHAAGRHAARVAGSAARDRPDRDRGAGHVDRADRDLA